MKDLGIYGQVAEVFSNPTLNLYEKLCHALSLTNKVQIGCGSLELSADATLTQDGEDVEGPAAFHYIVKSAWSPKHNRTMSVILSTAEINLDTCTEEDAAQYMELMDQLQAAATKLFMCTIPGAVQQEAESGTLLNWLSTDDMQFLREILAPLREREDMAEIFGAITEAEALVVTCKYQKEQQRKVDERRKAVEKANNKTAGVQTKTGSAQSSVPLWVSEAFSFAQNCEFNPVPHSSLDVETLTSPRFEQIHVSVNTEQLEGLAQAIHRAYVKRDSGSVSQFRKRGE